MDGFDWDYDGEPIHVVFSLIRNARWLNEDTKSSVTFDYLDYEDVVVMSADLDVEDSEYDRELWSMLLQVTNLDAS